jgi:hypothetical protein
LLSPDSFLVGYKPTPSYPILDPKPGMGQINNDRGKPMTITKIDVNPFTYTKFFNNSFLHFYKPPNILG